MEVKWYWPAEQLGLVQDISHLYNDGHTYYQVSAQADEVFFTFTLLLLPTLFFLGTFITMFTTGKPYYQTAQKILSLFTWLLLLYSLLLATGIGPYIIFYPQGSGFIDLSTLEHIIEGGYCALLSLCLFLGRRLGHRISKYHKNQQ